MQDKFGAVRNPAASQADFDSYRKELFAKFGYFAQGPSSSCGVFNTSYNRSVLISSKNPRAPNPTVLERRAKLGGEIKEACSGCLLKLSALKVPKNPCGSSGGEHPLIAVIERRENPRLSQFDKDRLALPEIEINYGVALSKASMYFSAALPNQKKGWFFRQYRVFGPKLAIFTKFRTMDPDKVATPEQLRRLAESTKKCARSDPRITFWGKLARDLHIDEFPQLLHLFTGKLRLIGVRPCLPAEFHCMPEELKQLRRESTPGLINFQLALRETGHANRVQDEISFLKAQKESPFLTDIKFLSIIGLKAATWPVRWLVRFASKLSLQAA